MCNAFRCIREFALVQFLLTKKERIDEDTLSSAALRAARVGDYSILLLLIREGVDPSVEGNEAIRIATRNGSYEIVKLLLQHPKVNPMDGRRLPQFNDDDVILGSAIEEALQWRHYGILRLFLKDKRVTLTQELQITYAHLL